MTTDHGDCAMLLSRRTPLSAILLAVLLCSLAGQPAVAEDAASSTCEPVTPNAFQGADSERINQAIAAGAASGRRVVIPKTNHAADGPRDIWLLDSAILVQSGTTLDLENCRIKLSDRCRDNIIRHNRVYCTPSFSADVNGIALVNEAGTMSLLNTLMSTLWSVTSVTGRSPENDFLNSMMPSEFGFTIRPKEDFRLTKN